MRLTRLRPGLASISMPLVSGSAGSVRTSRPSPPGNSSGDQPLELHRHVAVGGGERLGDLAVDLRDHLQQVAAGLLHVVQLALP